MATPTQLGVAFPTAVHHMFIIPDNALLPLDKDRIKSIAVIGPIADDKLALLGNYFGTPSKYVTVLEGIRQAVDDETTRVDG